MVFITVLLFPNLISYHELRDTKQSKNSSLLTFLFPSTQALYAQGLCCWNQMASPTHAIRAVGQLNLLPNYTIILHRVLLATWNKISEISGKISNLYYFELRCSSLWQSGALQTWRSSLKQPPDKFGVEGLKCAFQCSNCWKFPQQTPFQQQTASLDGHSTVESRIDTLVTTWDILKVTCVDFTASLHPAVKFVPFSFMWKDIHVLSCNPAWLYTTKSSCHFHGIVVMTLRSWVPVSELRCICMLNTKHIVSNPREKKNLLIFLTLPALPGN